jgi:anti-sigma regulatory factor (Ser/Thr protein kinase)
MEPIKLVMTLPPIPNIELVAISGMEQMAHHIGIRDDKIGEARVLVAEAIINAMEYATATHPRVDVEFTMDSQKLVIFVRDYGHGFDFDSVEEPDLKQKLKASHKRGWGIKLIKSLSDDFKIESDEEGTRITMLKKLA